MSIRMPISAGKRGAERGMELRATAWVLRNRPLRVSGDRLSGDDLMVKRMVQGRRGGSVGLQGPSKISLAETVPPQPDHDTPTERVRVTRAKRWRLLLWMRMWPGVSEGTSPPDIWIALQPTS